MIAVCAAKFVGYVCKKMGRQGVTWAGKVAIKICPDILEQSFLTGTKGYFCNLRYKWKDNYQQYALCGTGSGRTESNL